MIRISFVLATFFFVYLLAAILPAVGIMTANAIIDPSNPWVCVADQWFTNMGVHADLSPWAVCGIYGLIVLKPALSVAHMVAFEWLDDRVLA